MSSKSEDFFAQLESAVKTDQIILPTLPEVALKIRESIESETTSAKQIADTLSQDASLSARLIQVANSPLYRSHTPIDDLQMAVTRLGIKMVRDLVVSLAMKQIYQATSDVLDQHFRNAWNTSVEVAAISRMLATTVGINPEQALLAGLIHNIGSLPIVVLAEDDDELFQDSNALSELIWALQDRVGEMILRSWNFPDSMIQVVKNCHQFDYDHGGDATLVDVIQVAILQGGHIDHKHAPTDWQDVPAFAKLALDTDVNVIEIEENKEMIENTRQTLMV